MTKKQEKAADRAEAIAQLREVYPPGSTVSTLLRHVSRSGMSRTIVVIRHEEDISWQVARAIDMPFDRNRGGIKVSGCGMDMGFHVAYVLSRTLYAGGFGCIGKPNDAARRWSGACPSNDHSNGDRDYTPHVVCISANNDCAEHLHWKEDCPARDHWHKDGGHALLHRWI